MFKVLVVITLSIVVIFNVYLLNQVKALSIEISSEPDIKVIHSIIEQYQQDNILVLQKREQKRKFSQLQSEFALANIEAKTLIYGNLDARISMVMFGDIECPFCKKLHPELKQIVDNSKGVINWHYKHFPLSRHNPAAALSAQAVECILETHDNQSAWIALTEFIQSTQGNGRGIENIIELSRSFGLNGSLIKFCLNSDAHKNKINDDYAYGRSLNVTSTPSIQIIDNQTNHSLFLKGYLPAEAILEKIHDIVNGRR